MELITALVGLLGGVIALWQTRQKNRGIYEKQQLEIKLAEINARREAEASNDDLMRGFMEMQKMLLTSNSDALRDSLGKLVLVQKEGNADLLHAFKTEMNLARGEMAVASKDSRDAMRGLRTDVQTVPEIILDRLRDPLRAMQDETAQRVIKELSAVNQHLGRLITDAATNTLSRADFTALKQECISKLEAIEDRLPPKPPNAPLSKDTKPIKPDNTPGEGISDNTARLA